MSVFEIMTYIEDTVPWFSDDVPRLLPPTFPSFLDFQLEDYVLSTDDRKCLHGELTFPWIVMRGILCPVMRGILCPVYTNLNAKTLSTCKTIPLDILTTYSSSITL